MDQQREQQGERTRQQQQQQQQQQPQQPQSTQGHHHHHHVHPHHQHHHQHQRHVHQHRVQGRLMFAALPNDTFQPVVVQGNVIPASITDKRSGQTYPLISKEEKDKREAKIQEERHLQELVLEEPLQVKDITKTSADVVWTGFKGANEHTEVHVEVAQGTAKLKEVGKTKSNHYKLEKLKAGKQYQVRLVPYHKGKRGNPTPTTSFTASTSAPSAMPPVMLGNRQPRALGLKWGKPADSGGLPVDAYTVFWDKGDADMSEDDFVQVYTGQGHSCKVKDLERAHVYRFVVECSNADGTSPRSPVAAIATSVDKPSAPGDITLVRAGVDFLTIRWGAADGNGAPIEHYTLQMDDPSTGYGFLPKYTSTDLQHTIKGLDKDAAYSFRVFATNKGDKAGPFSAIATFKTKPRAPPPPSAPTRVGKVQATAFKVSWKPPPDPEDPVVRFTLEMDQGQRPPKPTKSGQVKVTPRGLKVVYTGEEPSFTATNLQPGHVYSLRCCCVGEGGQGVFSKLATVTTLPELPQPPSLYEPIESTSTCLHIGWRPPPQGKDGGEQPAEYEVVQVGPFMGTAVDAVTVMVMDTTMGDPPDDLFADETSGGGGGGAADKKNQKRGNARTKSNSSHDGDHGGGGGKKKNQGGSGGGDKGDGHTGDVPDSSNDKAAPGGDGRSGGGGGVQWQPLCRETTRRSAFAVVQPGEIHAFRARCRNRRGWSAWSEPLVLEARAMPPEPPSNLTAESSKATTATLTFSAGFENGSPVTKFRVRYAVAGNDDNNDGDGGGGGDDDDMSGSGDIHRRIERAKMALNAHRHTRMSSRGDQATSGDDESVGRGTAAARVDMKQPPTRSSNGNKRETTQEADEELSESDESERGRGGGRGDTKGQMLASMALADSLGIDFDAFPWRQQWRVDSSNPSNTASDTETTATPAYRHRDRRGDSTDEEEGELQNDDEDTDNGRGNSGGGDGDRDHDHDRHTPVAQRIKNRWRGSGVARAAKTQGSSTASSRSRDVGNDSLNDGRAKSKQGMTGRGLKRRDLTAHGDRHGDEEEEVDGDDGDDGDDGEHGSDDGEYGGGDGGQSGLNPDDDRRCDEKSPIDARDDDENHSAESGDDSDSKE